MALHHDHDLPAIQGWFYAFVDIMGFYMGSIYVEVALCKQCATSSVRHLSGTFAPSSLFIIHHMASR